MIETLVRMKLDSAGIVISQQVHAENPSNFRLDDQASIIMRIDIPGHSLRFRLKRSDALYLSIALKSVVDAIEVMK